jgi:hypothetical protein
VKRAIFALAVAACLSMSGVEAASASPTTVGNGERRVCAVAPSGFAACTSHVVTAAASGQPLVTTSYQNGFNPANLVGVYKPGTSSAIVAVIDAYANPNALTDLAAYRTQFKLGTANLTQVSQSGGSIATVAANVNWGQEEMLDLEMVSAICPSCSILYVGAKSASFSDLAAAVTTANSMHAKVISNSYGGNEFSSETSSQSVYNIPGVAVTVSSGDSGYGAQFPATAQDVIAVGGTSLTLNADGTRHAETVWSGAGSGCSAYITKPTWQTDSGCSRRTEADVAAVADPNTGVAVYDSYGSSNGANWYVFGGTSVAAPLVGAIYATFSVPVGSSGYAAQNAWANRSSLFDVTSGSNGQCTKGHNTSAAYLCNGIAGYDGPSGNGTPNGTASPF